MISANKREYLTCVRKHFKKRMKQRYGISINSKESKNIIRLIKDDKCTLVMEDTNTRNIYEIEYKEDIIYVVYSKKSNVLVTALTKEQIEEKKLRLEEEVKCLMEE